MKRKNDFVYRWIECRIIWWLHGQKTQTKSKNVSGAAQISRDFKVKGFS